MDKKQFAIWKHFSLVYWLYELFCVLLFWSVVGFAFFCIIHTFSLSPDALTIIACILGFLCMCMPLIQCCSGMSAACVHETDRWIRDSDSTDSMAWFGFYYWSFFGALCCSCSITITVIILSTLIFLDNEDSAESQFNFAIFASFMFLSLLCGYIYWDFMSIWIGNEFPCGNWMCCLHFCWKHPVQYFEACKDAIRFESCKEPRRARTGWSFSAATRMREAWIEEHVLSLLQNGHRVEILENIRANFLPQIGKYKSLPTYKPFEFGDEMGISPNCAFDEVFQFIGSYSTHFLKHGLDSNDGVKFYWCDLWCSHSPCAICCASTWIQNLRRHARHSQFPQYKDAMNLDDRPDPSMAVML